MRNMSNIPFDVMPTCLFCISKPNGCVNVCRASWRANRDVGPDQQVADVVRVTISRCQVTKQSFSFKCVCRISLCKQQQKQPFRNEQTVDFLSEFFFERRKARGSRPATQFIIRKLLIPCFALFGNRFSPSQYAFTKVPLIIEEAPHRDTQFPICCVDRMTTIRFEELFIIVILGKSNIRAVRNILIFLAWLIT